MTDAPTRQGLHHRARCRRGRRYLISPTQPYTRIQRHILKRQDATQSRDPGVELLRRQRLEVEEVPHSGRQLGMQDLFEVWQGEWRGEWRGERREHS